MRYSLYLVALATLATLTITVNAGATRSAIRPPITNHGSPAGVVPVRDVSAQQVIGGNFRGPRGGRPPAIGAAGQLPPSPKKIDNLTYHGPDQPGNGPVMHSTTVYAIFWDPGNTLPAAYKTTVGQYFTDVAHDNGRADNVYSVATQYSDTTGPVSNNTTYGGALNDTNAFPASGCPTPAKVLDTTVCLTDDQIQAEIQAYVDDNSLPTGPTTEYFLYTGKNTGSCFPDPNADSGFDCAYAYYCAYHSAFFAGNTEYIYSNMAWPDQPITSGSGQRTDECDTNEHPNGDNSTATNDANAADNVLSVTSHEHNESITDPLGNAWWTDNAHSQFAGSEDGDLCSWSWFYPTKLNGDGSPAAYGPDGTGDGVGGGSMDAGSAWNQTINGHHYFLQGEWSNKSATTTGWSGCQWTYNAGPSAGDTRPSITGAGDIQVGTLITGHTGTWVSNSGGITSFKYTWMRCDQNGAKCKAIKTNAVAAVRGVLGVSGADNTYTVQQADYLFTLVLSVSAVDTSGTSVASLSDPTDVVHGEPTPGSESLSGPTTVGVAMTGSISGWNANSSAITSYAWSWLRCPTAALTAQCKKAKSGTQTTAADVQYTAMPADDKLYMAFQVVAKNNVGSSQPDTVVEASPVNGEPVDGLTSPEITGTTTVGQTLTANLHQPSWSPTPTSYKVVWSRTLNAKTTTITTSTVKQGAANPTYKLVAADDKAVIQISVTALNTAGSSIPANATTSSAVNGEPTGGSAAITGSTAPKGMLTATASGFGNSPTKYQYQWLRCAGDGTGCTIFKTVTVSTTTTKYTTVASDNGHKLEVRITAFNAAGSSDVVMSALVGPIGI